MTLVSQSWWPFYYVTSTFDTLSIKKDDLLNSLHDKDVSSIHDHQHQTLPPEKEKQKDAGMNSDSTLRNKKN